MVTCSICFEATQEVGEIDSCYHRFCWPCINQWADRDSRCPLCKQRFTRIRRKALQVGDLPGQPPSKRHKPNSESPEPADSPSTPPQQGDVATAADGSEAAAATASPAEEPGSPKGELEGVVLETRKVRKKDQVYRPEDDAEDLQELVETVHCLVCGADDNDEHLLICDGCDNGYHTYCVNRRTVPLGDWFCPDCVEEHRLREERRQQRRAERRAYRLEHPIDHVARGAELRAASQHRQLQQDLRRTGTRQYAAARAAATAAAAAAGRRRLQRGAGAAGDVGSDEVDLSLEDSDVDVSDNAGAAVLPRGRGRGRRAASTRGRQALGDSDSDYEADLQDDSDSAAAADSGESDDLQDSDWEGGAVRTAQGRRRIQGPRRTQAPAGSSRDAAGCETAAVSPSAAHSGSTRQAARRRRGRGAVTEADGIHQRLARSAGHAAAMAATDARSAGVVGRDGSRLKTWQELRAEEEREAAAAAAITVAAANAADHSGPGASGAVPTARASVQIADLLKAVNQERRSRQAQGLSSGAARAGSNSPDPENQAWAALDTVRSAGRETSSRGRSRSASAASAGLRRAASAAGAAGARQGAASSYFNTSQRQQQQGRQTGQGSSTAGSAQQQQHAQLKQALMARLQQQQQTRQEQHVARGRSYQQLADSDPRDPYYMDVIRDSVVSAREKGEEDRRRRSLAEATAAAKVLPAGTVPAGTVKSRGAAAAKRIANIQAAAARTVVSGPAAAAAQQPVSRLARSLSAAQQTELQKQQHRPRQPSGSRQGSSSNFMDSWLSRGASSRDAGRPLTAALGTGQHERAHLPRSVRTLGAVKRGAAAQAAAAAAAETGGVGSGSSAGGRSGQQQQQASRQPLELKLSRQKQPAPQYPGNSGAEIKKEMHTVKQDSVQQPSSSSRYFGDYADNAEGQLQQHSSRLRQELGQPHHIRRSFEGQRKPGLQLSAAGAGAEEQQHAAAVAAAAAAAASILQQHHHLAAPHDLHQLQQQQQQQQPMHQSLYHLMPYGMLGYPNSQHPLAGAVQGQQCGIVQQHLLHNLQPGHSDTSNSSGTTFAAVPEYAPGPAVVTTAVPGCAGVLPLPAVQQQMADMYMLGQLRSAVVLPGQVPQPPQPPLDHLSAHQQQQSAVCSAPQELGSSQDLQVASAVSLTREQLKYARYTTAELVKSKLRPLYGAKIIDKEEYKYAAETASQKLYDQVKAGAIQYDAVVAAADKGKDGGNGAAELIKTIDELLQTAGVKCSDAVRW